MTSHIEAWKELYALDQVRLPADIDELAVICCESRTRTVSDIGIELENCIFNNSTLQQLRRRIAPGGETKVELRYNSARMDRIWVQDPVTLHRFDVLNLDPVTKDLSAHQVAVLEALRRKSQSIGTIITRAQARKQIQDTYQPLLLAKTMQERRRALKILGLIAKENPPKKTKNVKPTTPRKGKSTNKHLAAPVQEPAAAIEATRIGVVPPGNLAATSPPKFKVVRQGSTRDEAEFNATRNADGQSN